MNRAEFLTGAAFALYAPKVIQQDVSDPANAANTQALRVLLGKGPAQKLDAQTFLFEGRRYRGAFSYDDAGAINTVSLEQYLYSVVPREMPRTWPPAALQTQAILARTYVLQRSNPSRAYDLVPSEADQVYTGIDAEHPETSAAVDGTAGMVLRFGNTFAQALYSSCCGGHTEASSQAWGGPPLAYLSGVACAYCAGSPWYQWTQDLPLEALQQELVQQLAAVGDLEDITLDPPDGSGRSHFWNFQGTTGTQRIKAADVRQQLGTRRLPSLLVHRIAVSPPAPQGQRTLAIEGGGLGHGVGLCQWGARGMAMTGANAQSIVSFYFPGTGIGHD